MKHRIFGVSRRRFFLYCISMLIGVALSVLFIALGTIYNNSVINYFLGFSASLIITVIFAYLIDFIGQKEIRDLEKTKRTLYLQPISMKIIELFHRIMFFNITSKEFEDREYTIDDFETCYKRVFLDYCKYLEKLIGENRPLPEVNAAFGIKNSIQEWCLKEIVRSVNVILDNEIVIKAESLLNDKELFLLERLKEIAEHLHLPYLDTMSSDKNTAKAFIDWPKEQVNDIVKNNYNGQIRALVNELKSMAKTFDEFKSIINIKFKVPKNNLHANEN